MNIGLIILAAGSSTRLGRAKQLLLFNGVTFIEHAISVATSLPFKQIIIITGSNNELIDHQIDNAVTTIYNDEWQEGMASSIRKGIQQLNADASIDQAIIMVCDQPYVSTQLLNKLITVAQTSGKGIVGSTYQQTVGTPVLFNRKYFELLAQLAGDKGAKEIVQRNEDDLATIAFEKGAIDIDTEADYRSLLE